MRSEPGSFGRTLEAAVGEGLAFMGHDDERSAIADRCKELGEKLREKQGIAENEARHRVEASKVIVRELKKARFKLIGFQKELWDKLKWGNLPTKKKDLFRRRI